MVDRPHILIVGQPPTARTRVARLASTGLDGVRLAEAASADAARGLYVRGVPNAVIVVADAPRAGADEPARAATWEEACRFCRAVVDSLPAQGAEAEVAVLVVVSEPERPDAAAGPDDNPLDAIGTELESALLSSGAIDVLPSAGLTPGRLRSSLRLGMETCRQRAQARRADAQLETQNSHVLRLNQLAKDFVDQVSGDFRSPVSVIRESAAILYDGLLGPLTPEQREYAAVVIDRAGDVSMRLEDLVDMSRMEAGSLPLRRSFSSVREILDRAQTTLQFKALAARMGLETDAAADLPAVFCDPERATRVVVHLAAHAMRVFQEAYNGNRRPGPGPSGAGRIHVWAHPDSGGHRVRIGVSVSADTAGLDRTSPGGTNGSRRAPALDAGFLCRGLPAGSKAHGRPQLPGKARLKPASAPGPTQRLTPVAESPGTWCPVGGFPRGLDAVRELARLNLGDMFVHAEDPHGSVTFGCTLPSGGPVEVLREFVDRLNEPVHAARVGHETAEGRVKAVTLLTVRCGDGQSGATGFNGSVADDKRSVRELSLFLQQFTRANDVLFALDGGRWLLAAACDASGAERLIERFRQAWLDYAQSRVGGSVPTVHFERHYTWMRPAPPEKLFETAEGLLGSPATV